MRYCTWYPLNGLSVYGRAGVWSEGRIRGIHQGLCSRTTVSYKLTCTIHPRNSWLPWAVPVSTSSVAAILCCQADFYLSWHVGCIYIVFLKSLEILTIISDPNMTFLNPVFLILAAKRRKTAQFANDKPRACNRDDEIWTGREIGCKAYRTKGL